MNTPCNNSDIVIALIGVGGTLAGTVLGWILNSISQKGNLKISVFSWKDSFEYNNMGCMAPSSSIEQTELYQFDAVLDIFNSSKNVKIMRNIRFAFCDKEKCLKLIVPKDASTRRSSGPISFYDDVAPLNIPPQTIIQIKLNNGVWAQNGEMDFIWNVAKVYLIYENDKGKTKQVLLNEEMYKDYFQNHIVEGNEDG